jgi:hypothetical protein
MAGSGVRTVGFSRFSPGGVDIRGGDVAGVGLEDPGHTGSVFQGDFAVAMPWQSAVIQSGGLCHRRRHVGDRNVAGIAGAFTSKLGAPGFGKLMGKIIVPTVVVPPLEEWMIRGLLLGCGSSFRNRSRPVSGFAVFRLHPF